MSDQRQRHYIATLESAGADEFAALLRSPSVQESRWLEEHFGAGRLEELRTLAAPRRTQVRGNVVLLPGILGSHLALTEGGGNSTIWISPWSLLKGQFNRLRLDERGRSRHPVFATGALKRYYGKPLLHLARRWNVRAFAYDWRLSIRASAAQLARSVNEWFGPDEPVHFVAHSMGGLVARAYSRAYPERWSRGGRLVMLGTPNAGSYAIPQLFAGYHSLLGVLALIDLRHSKEGLRRVIATFEGAAEMLPAGEPMLRERSRYGAGAPAESLLRRIEETQLWLASAVDPRRMSYIAGSGQMTAVGVKDAGRLHEKSAYRWNRQGDGTVPHSLGLLKDVPAYFAGEEHGKLQGNPEVLAAVEEILETGRCWSLGSKPVETRAGSGMDDAVSSGQPADGNPVDELLSGFAGVTEPLARLPKIRFRVRHGSLEQARDAAAVGYYSGARPRYFANRPELSELAGRGMLGAELGAPFFLPGEPPLILMCLGPIGRLGSQELALYVRRLCWTAAHLGHRRLATALTGSGRGNLSVRQAAGIWRREAAHSALEELTFFETDGGRARELAGVMGVRVSAAERRAASPPSDPSEYASRLSIERSARGVRVALLTGDASQPEREVQIDFALALDINHRLAQASGTAEEGEWAECLAKLLLPAELRNAFGGAGPMVISCDAETARVHWEMLRCGSVTRQLKTLHAPILPPGPASGRVLIVADTCEEAPLAAAREEGERLAELLSGLGLEVTALIGPRQAHRAAVVRELLLREYGVFHFAGHCSYSTDGGSGWLFSGGALLGANELQRVDRVPAFVFSNACESGRMGPSLMDAAGFAESFFARGVQNLVCTAWPVGDGEAAAFAASVYQNADKPIHLALAEARKQSGARPGRWQHYGNPFYRIFPKS